MAAKGTEFKKEIVNKLLQVFPGSFLCNGGKEIRICGQENGEEIQIKVALTCAKENISADNEDFPEVSTSQIIKSETTAPTQEEKDNIRKLMEALNL